MISINDMTLQYRSGKGVFDLSFEVKEGEVFGYLGPNGSGKTTTIRNLLGFYKPNKGTCSINGLDCWKQAAGIQKQLGYIPGEIAFFDGMQGTTFLDLLGDMRRTKDKTRRKDLLDRFELDPSGVIRKMSKGMKQKLGIVAAFMHDPAVLVLDEPSAGLDPLMQNIFVDYILEEKQRGKTILMSSHSFEEIDRTCDRAGIIREGRLVDVQDVHELKQVQRKAFQLTLGSDKDVVELQKTGLEIGNITQNRVEVYISGETDTFIKTIAKVTVLGLKSYSQSLEQVFMQYYGQEAKV